MPSKSPPSLKARAIASLARREQSRASLTRKLLPDASSPEALSEVLDELEALGLLSDQRFAEAWVRQRSGRTGSSRLRQELLEKGVAEPLIEAALSAAESPEEERAFLAWQRRFGVPPESLAERAKQQRFLVQRGFGFDAFRAIERRGFLAPEDLDSH